MKITVTFDTMEEFEKFRGASTPEEAIVGTLAAKPTPTEKEAPPAAVEEVESNVNEEEPKEKKPVGTEEMRVEIRSILAKLNKKVGSNAAKDIISCYGVEKLTDVKLEDLPALLEDAEAAFNAN